MFHDGWAPGIIDFPEDDDDDLSTLADYHLIRQRQRPKSYSPPTSSPIHSKVVTGRNKGMERQVR